MERLLLLVLLLCGCLYGMTAQAKTCSLKSPSHKVALLELYTSEGCSSCPPADEWLSSLPQRGLDMTRVVPLSLHVDYWNYIGWADPYSSSQFTQRQREIAFRNRLRTIYTPQMVLEGRDFRSWRRVDVASLIKSINNEPAVADIHLTISPSSQRVIDIKVDASVPEPEKYAGSRLLVAVYENDLKSNVTAGENDGRVLLHDFVVRKLYTAGTLSADGRAAYSDKLVIPPEWNTAQLGIAAFLEHPQHGTLQALANELACDK